MSQPAGTSDSVVVSSVERPLPLPPLPAIYGDPSYLSRSSVAFKIAYRIEPEARGALWASFDLYSQPGLTRWINSRAAAQVDFPLNISFVVSKLDAATELYFSGSVAVLADDPSFALDAIPVANRTKERVLSIDGSDAFTGSQLVMATAVVHQSIGVQLEAKLHQVIGFKPRFLLAGHSSGLSSLTVVISSTVHLSSICAINPF